MNTRFNNHLIDNRQVRIFLSSTFSDMQKERDALIQMFETLKVEAAKRDVSLSVVDLRWGVTDEEARTGKVISVCLNEIENSHPFFIGILGNRYGTVPNSSEFLKNPDLLERYDWLNNVISDNPNEGMSITEMEIQYGVLLNENEIDAAFFFRKSDKPDDDNRLTMLKEKVRRKYDPDYQNDYTTLDELCEKVATEIKKIIDKHFPKKDTVTLLDQERTAHRAFINSRHRYFKGREEDLGYLDNFVRSNRRYLVITGESGIGKSALLANWVRSNHVNDSFNLVYHFVGNSFSSNSYVSVLSHLCDEICDIYKIERNQNQQEKLEEEAQRLLSELANRKKPLVVVIDGINQIIATKDEKLLLWLPTANDNVKFIFTTLCDDTTMQALEHRGCEVYVLEALSDFQRKELAIEYLKQVGKDIDEQLMERIINDKESRNTLVLRTFLDELICFGSYEHLAERVDYYLSAKSIPDFFDKMLQRMEQDYNNDQDLVHRALSLIALSEHGLSEDELMVITNFRQMDWHFFYCAFFNHFVEKEGLISFSHQYITDAIINRYALGDANDSASYRQEIVAYFAFRGWSDEIQQHRRISELAHQYYNLEDWPNLHNILLDFEAFNYLYNVNVQLLAKYWRALIMVDSKQYRLSDYLHISLQLEDTSVAVHLNNIGLFVFNYFAEYETAMDYYQKVLEIREKILGTEHVDTAISYNNVGTLYDAKDDYVKALEYYEKALTIRKKALGEEHLLTAQSYHNIGETYNKMGDYDKALEYFFKALAIKEKALVRHHPSTALTYNNIGTVYDAKGKYVESWNYYCKALEIRELVFGVEHMATSESYNNIGELLRKRGEYNQALECHNRVKKIRENILGVEHLDTAVTYNNIGLVYLGKRNYNTALEYLNKALTIFEKKLKKNHHSIAQVYNNIGLVFDADGDYDKALEYYNEALKAYRGHPNAATTYSNIGTSYYEKGELDKALECYLKSLDISEKKHAENNPDTAITYNVIGVLYYKQGELVKALEYHKKAYLIFEKVYGPNHPNTINVLKGISIINKSLEV